MSSMNHVEFLAEIQLNFIVFLITMNDMNVCKLATMQDHMLDSVGRH